MSTETLSISTPTLYGIAASRASRNLWLLEELQTPYHRNALSYKNGGSHTPEYLAINPNGHVPVLVDGELVIWESLAINLYLAEKHGGTLAAANLAEKAEFLKWSFWVVTECERDALTVLMHGMVMPAEMRKPELFKQAVGALRKPLAVLDQHLANRIHMVGERFTTLDINLASILNWIRPAPVLLSEFTHVARWLSACIERPCFKAAQNADKK